MLETMAQNYGKRPSEIIGILNEFEAFDFDLSVMIFAEKKRKEIETSGGTNGEPEMTELERLQMQFAKIKVMQNADSPYA